MSSLRFLRFEDPHAYLETTKDHDDSFMNFGIGSLWDFLSGLPARQMPDVPTYIFTIYRGDDLLITLSINKQDFAWMMSTPSSADEKLSTDPKLLAAATTLLATSVLATLSSPRDFDKIIGPLKPVEAFLNTWVALLAAQGVSAKILIRESEAVASRVSYATRASLPPPLAVAPPYRVERAGRADLPGVAILYQHFQLTSPWRGIISIEDAILNLTGPADLGLVWVCRLEDAAPDGPPAAFSILGRITPRTIAIRNVYVAPDHRRKGVAETMVRAVTRYFLGAAPYGVHGVPDGPPQCGFKQEVNLNVADPSAEGVYRRSGFLFPVGTGENMTGGVDPETGRRSWYPSVWRGVEVEADTEPEAKA
ncbi:hypothetical protein GSI_07026 [Ganoderma sinense ZZ0214-1]|uniref:N-acetyltransferase domain-containing protein n=1 Tax=Ganoderma sinense ZZ0214-1 TaxID=1077348 RepID=A0A2G8SB77_9APHY|nr:hypothetical protein GSI_07026 [Ganoderma sinense ZZ0214-1]